MKKTIFLSPLRFLWVGLAFFGGCQQQLTGQQTKVRVGAEILIESHLSLIQGKRVGVVCNHTSVLPNGTHLVDTLLSHGVNLVGVFGPEHGFRGEVPAGEKVQTEIDSKTGLPIYSLYGVVKKPTEEMLRQVDVLIFDIQDVGARFYTYYITMSHAMEATALSRKEFIILDRPNPIGGVAVEGPLLDPKLESDVGRFPLPIRHGLTIGELGRMLVGEGWITFDPPSLFRVIPMEGWKRTMWYDDTHLQWVSPSPNMKLLSTATVYSGTCLFEGTNISEGRGTAFPFEYIGAPWLDGEALAEALNDLRLEGVRFASTTFTPIPDAVVAPNPKYSREVCYGVHVQVTERDKFQPVTTAIKMLYTIKSFQPSEFVFNASFFDRLAGTFAVRRAIEGQANLDSLLETWEDDRLDFREMRGRYLLY